MAIAAVLVLAQGMGAAPAGAHAALEDTDPVADALLEQAPGAVQLRFDEPVSASTGSVQVIAPSGDRVDGSVDEADGGRTISIEVDGGGRGTYTVAYRVVSDDGHTITGSFVFHVGERTGAATVDQSIPVATSAAGGIGRWLGYAGAAVAVGTALLLVVLRRRHAGGEAVAIRRFGTIVLVGAGASALGTATAVVAQVASTTGRSLVGALGLVAEVAGDSRSVAWPR